MILLLTILALALLGTLGCIGSLVYVNSKEHEVNQVMVTDIPEELTRTYFQKSWRALAEDAINSSETYVRLSRPDGITASTPSQSYRRALASVG
ncbi:MAG TPA: hypothetical protein VH330_10985 [Candidatus Udaeobacter sp.]|jgi:hypothetical protein